MKFGSTRFVSLLTFFFVLLVVIFVVQYEVTLVQYPRLMLAALTTDNLADVNAGSISFVDYGPGFADCGIPDKPKKLAFMFLTTGNLAMPKVWHRFFYNVDPACYNIYTHTKYEDTLMDANTFAMDGNQSYHRPGVSQHEFYLTRDMQIGNIEHNTAWANISLIRAENHLLKHAFRHDKHNYKFIFMSETHIPLYNFSYTYHRLVHIDQDQASIKILKTQETTHLMSTRMFDLKKHWEHHPKQLQRRKSLTYFNRLEHLHPDWLDYRSSQWLILNRYLARVALKNDFSRFYGDYAWCPDEYYYLQVFLFRNVDLKLHINDVEATCSVWGENFKFHEYGVPTKKRSKPPRHITPDHPHPLNYVSNALIDYCRENGNVFVRKVLPNTQIQDESYLFG